MAMVIPALRYQTSREQREAWLPLATSFRILGAYVQTELGHGSNVRALETTATFDKARVLRWLVVVVVVVVVVAAAAAAAAAVIFLIVCIIAAVFC